MKNFNRVDASGRLVKWKLDEGTDKNGQDYISGEITLAVDDEGTEMRFRVFANPRWKKSGKTNGNYTILEKILHDEMGAGEWLSVRGSVDVDYFVPKEARDDNDDGLARTQRMSATFINANNDEKYENKWRVDMLITSVREVEADEERQIPRYAQVKGYIVDDYHKRLMEVQFDARKDAAINYVLGLQCSKDVPYFVSVTGHMERVTRSVVLENAFGDPETQEYASTRWAITRMPPQGYNFGDESDITVEEYNEYLAGLQEYKDSKKTDNDEPDLAF